MDPMSIIMSLLPVAIGALPAAMDGNFGGKNEKFGSTYGKNQIGTINQMLQDLKGMKGAQDITQNPNYQSGEQWLQSMFSDPSFFQNFEAPLQRQFQEQTIPDLANRFASMGSGGSLGSTGFRNQLAREGSNLGTNIAALRGGMQQQAIPQLLGYSQQPFSNYMSMLQNALTPTNNQYQPATPGLGGNLLSSFTGGAAQAVGNMWGQGMGNMWGQPSNTTPNAPVGNNSSGSAAGWDNMFRQTGVV